MKTTYDIENALYGLLNVSDFKSLFAGKLYNGRRPATATVAEDVVINATTVDADQVQGGVAYVKCWAKDVGGFANPKLDGIIKKASELIESSSVDGYEFEILSTSTIPDDQNAGWSIGIVRIECFINNL